MEERRRDAGTLASADIAGGSPASEPATRRRAGALKRKANAVGASNSSSTPSKRMMTREKAMLASLSPVQNGPLTRARQAPSALASSATAAGVVKQEMVNAAEAAVGEKPKDEEELNQAIREWEALEAKIEAEFEAIRSRDSNAHVVPYHCGWFSWQKIHPLEERSLPSFFNGKSEGRTSEVYMEIRNWIMRKFHSNPNMQIELKDLTELEVGDSDAKEEVLEFLDFWGLINFHPFLPAESGSAAVDDDEVEDKDSLLNSLYHFQAVEACPAPVLRPNLTAQAIPSGLFPESMVSDDLMKQEGPEVEYHCNSCSADCSRKRYHCPKQADFDLCTECFNSGKFGSDMSSSDFILMEPAEAPGAGSGKWTDQENLLLLEALELFKENWNEIAEHVATKTKAQCMLHFLQMPIEDAFLDQIDDKEPGSKKPADSVASKDGKSVEKDAPESTERVNDGESLTSPKDFPQPGDDNEGKISQESSKTEDASQEANEVKVDQNTSKPDTVNDVTCKDEAGEDIALKALAEAFEDVGYPLKAETNLSFADLGNPVMGLAAFLVRLTESDVATASVRASLKYADSSSPGLWLATNNCFFLEDPPDNKKDSTGFESVDAEVNHHNTQKDEQPEERSQERKDQSLTADGVEISNTDQSKETQDSVSGEKQPGSPTDESSRNPDALREKSKTSLLDKSSEKELLREKDSEKDVNKLSGESKEPCQVTYSQSDVDASQPAKTATDVEMVDTFASSKETHDTTAKDMQDEVQEAKENTKDVLVAPNTSNGQQPVRSASPSTNGATDEDSNKEGKKEKHLCEVTEDKSNMGKLKRAAVSALCAAAVKAKHLAKQEEDQIRQLSVSLIEKQLHKLEMKLTVFSEMENLTMRVREQLERSRQRLYHERAQIIAARLGVPPTSSSSSKASLPTNRIAANFANVVPRPPPIGMAYPRPPIPRPMATSVLAGSSGPPPPPGSDNVS
ncbi:PREDICTED: SWI/SNF complex subunit SWI3D [Tarenaya hassleriana]|uniref:SWI/SNF complex subunit SWI3D n=1 Tax=Tarenaya hassleriana TaxID=28532 RepID=UPI00053C9983|nr:PREDICTED: SWI/SNF complex subunit SWI3D [Tarenaya hassleriana]